MSKAEKENRINSLAITFLVRQQIQPNIFADQIIRGYKEGYHQAEKDLELTNEDVYDIWRIYNEVCAEGKIFGFDETSQEVLKRFLERKKK